jgi:nucleoside-diphosphate-sugar epimerase
MRILILGYGFIGRYIAHELKSQGYEVFIFSKTISMTQKNDQIQGDVFNDDDLNKVIIWQPSIIISTVWSTNYDSYSNDSNNINYANFSISLADFCNRIGVKHLIILGSGAEYGNQKIASSAGTTVLNPLSIYAEQKVYAFNSINEIDKKFRFTWARIFYPYAPDQNPKRLIPYLHSCLINQTQIVLKDSTSKFDWVSTRDIALAVAWLVNNDSPIEVDIGTSIPYTNIELLEEICNVTHLYYRESMIKNLHITSNEVHAVSRQSPLLNMGWKPLDSLNEGLRWVFSNA